jgi:type VI secretion system protein ImpD
MDAASLAVAIDTPRRPPRPDLRLDLPAAIFATDPGSADRLDSFLAAESVGEALRLWMGVAAQRLAARPDELALLLSRDIAAIDVLLGDQVDAILHAPDFKRIEAAWRGVELLVDEKGSDDRVRVRVFNASWSELTRDFERSIEFDQSVLFAKTYNEEYGMPGGLPYGLLVCDYAVRHKAPAGHSGPVTDDVGALQSLAQVAAASFSPCVIGAAPELFGLSTFSDMSYVQRLDQSFKLGEYHRWHKLREMEDSRFLGVVLPRILLRDRYRDDPARQDGFRYEEGGNGVDSWLWGNAAFGFGAVSIRAFREWGWFAEVCGARQDELGGIVSNLPAPRFSTGESVAFRRPLEVELTDKKERALEDLGFISASPCNFTRSIVFLGAPSLHAPPPGGEAIVEANGRLSAMLNYIMCVSRFAHYVKVMARERLGAYTTTEELERYLDNWLREYTIGNSDAGPELKARHPLAGARLEMKNAPGRPGAMTCLIHLQPHFQFDQVISNFSMRTEVQTTRAR